MVVIYFYSNDFYNFGIFLIIIDIVGFTFWIGLLFEAINWKLLQLKLNEREIFDLDLVYNHYLNQFEIKQENKVRRLITWYLNGPRKKNLCDLSAFKSDSFKKDCVNEGIRLKKERVDECIVKILGSINTK